MKYLEKYPEEVRKKVEEYFEKLKSKASIKGRSEKAIIASILYYVLKENGNPKTFNEIAEEFEVEAREIKRNYRFFARVLGIKVLPVDPKLYIEKFCNEMKVSEKIRKRAIEILEKVKKKGLDIGISESILSASILYIASKLEKEEISQYLLAEYFKITPNTIRIRYKEIAEKLNIKIQKEMKKRRFTKIKSIVDLARALEDFSEDLIKRTLKFKFGNIGISFIATNDTRILEVINFKDIKEIGDSELYKKYRIAILLRSKKIEFKTDYTIEDLFPEFHVIKNIDRLKFKIAEGVKLYLERNNFWLEVHKDYSIDVNSNEYVLEDFRVYNKENPGDTKIWLYG